MNACERIVPRAGTRGEPRVTIYPSGYVYVNAMAYQALGCPRYVSIYRIDGEIEIRAEREPARDAFAVSRSGRGGVFSSARIGRMAAGTLRLPAAVGDGFLRVRVGTDGCGAGDAIRDLGNGHGTGGEAARRGSAEPGGTDPAE